MLLDMVCSSTYLAEQHLRLYLCGWCSKLLYKRALYVDQSGGGYVVSSWAGRMVYTESTVGGVRL
jgi:hypothetical protein